MRVLIVEPNEELARIWAGFLQRQGATVKLVLTQKAAINAMRFQDFDVLVVEVVLPDGGAISISDYAAYRHPNMPIIAVTDSSFFSNGTLFDLIPNARGMMRAPVRPEDLAAVLDHVNSLKRPA